MMVGEANRSRRRSLQRSLLRARARVDVPPARVARGTPAQPTFGRRRWGIPAGARGVSRRGASVAATERRIRMSKRIWTAIRERKDRPGKWLVDVRRGAERATATFTSYEEAREYEKEVRRADRGGEVEA